MASGHMNRVKRPDTWLHRPMLRNVKKVLANPEPSTHDPMQDIRLVDGLAFGRASPAQVVRWGQLLHFWSWPPEPSLQPPMQKLCVSSRFTARSEP